MSEAAGIVEVHVAAAVAGVCDLYEPLLGEDARRRTGAEQLQLLAQRLAEGHRGRHRGALVELGNWHPELIGRAEDEVWSARLDEGDYAQYGRPRPRILGLGRGGS